MGRADVGRPPIPRARGDAPGEGDWTGRWRPSLGAWIDGDGTRFRVWAPDMNRVAVVLEGEPTPRVVPLERFQDAFTPDEDDVKVVITLD